MATKRYDYLVIGSGSALTAVDMALSHGLRVALVDKGPTGGTCLNVGCIPSKLLIFPADRVVEIEDAARLGVYAEIMRVDFRAIMERMRSVVIPSRNEIRRSLRSAEGLDFYEGVGRFVDEYTLEVNGERLRADKIVIGAGARPAIPPIDGLDRVEYLTNETLLDLNHRPASMVIVGGGYVGVEYAHFFASVGTRVTLLQMEERLLMDEEPEISDLLKRKLAQRMTVHTGTKVVAVRRVGSRLQVVAADESTGEELTVEADTILLAAGRIPNSDLLAVQNSGVQVDGRGFIVVNTRMETSKENVWALGDVIGKAMFRHVANEEAYVAANNSLHDSKVEMSYHAVPHAVFTYPQIAAVGLTQREAARDHRLVIGYARYAEVAKGEAMMEEDAFAKAVVDADSREILGFHIIGPYAPILIQEVINAMAVHAKTGHIFSAMHIHPALPEVVQKALANLKEPEEWPHPPFPGSRPT
ncbi:MAG: dihydrolipoyl dehydrogenase [Anaerolineae bacterium]|nr:dihydrolipoyl dehydrogenase [Anaerolineae bacterium]